MGLLANGKLAPVNAEKVWSIPTSVFGHGCFETCNVITLSARPRGKLVDDTGGRQDILSPARLPHHLTGLVGMPSPLEMRGWPDGPAAPLFPALCFALRAWPPGAMSTCLPPLGNGGRPWGGSGTGILLGEAGWGVHWFLHGALFLGLKALSMEQVIAGGFQELARGLSHSHPKVEQTVTLRVLTLSWMAFLGQLALAGLRVLSQESACSLSPLGMMPPDYPHPVPTSCECPQWMPASAPAVWRPSTEVW